MHTQVPGKMPVVFVMLYELGNVNLDFEESSVLVK